MDDEGAAAAAAGGGGKGNRLQLNFERLKIEAVAPVAEPDVSPTQPLVGLAKGDTVSVKYRGKEWRRATIVGMRPEGSFDVAYDNGEHENGVPLTMLRVRDSPRHASAAASVRLIVPLLPGHAVYFRFADLLSAPPLAAQFTQSFSYCWLTPILMRPTVAWLLQGLDLTVDIEAAITPRGSKSIDVHSLKSRQELVSFIYRLQVSGVRCTGSSISRRAGEGAETGSKRPGQAEHAGICRVLTAISCFTTFPGHN